MHASTQVNPLILSESGGPCIPKDGNIWGPEYINCIEDVRREYVTSTAIASMLACLLMGLLANLPIALAPGMGINAYFTYVLAFTWWFCMALFLILKFHREQY